MKKGWSRILSAIMVLVPAAAFGLVSCAKGGGPRVVNVVSPDGRNGIALTRPAGPAGSPPSFSVRRSGRVIIEPSAFKVVLSGVGDIAAGARILSVDKDSVDESFELAWGKSRTARDRFSGPGSDSRVRPEFSGTSSSGLTTMASPSATPFLNSPG